MQAKNYVPDKIIKGLDELNKTFKIIFSFAKLCFALILEVPMNLLLYALKQVGQYFSISVYQYIKSINISFASREDCK